MKRIGIALIVCLFSVGCFGSNNKTEAELNLRDQLAIKFMIATLTNKELDKQQLAQIYENEEIQNCFDLADLVVLEMNKRHSSDYGKYRETLDKLRLMKIETDEDIKKAIKTLSDENKSK